MNSKLLYAATLAVSLLGGLAVVSGAMAATGDAAPTRAAANADLAAAVADGTRQRSDGPDACSRAAAAASTQQGVKA